MDTALGDSCHLIKTDCDMDLDEIDKQLIWLNNPHSNKVQKSHWKCSNCQCHLSESHQVIALKNESTSLKQATITISFQVFFFLCIVFAIFLG